MSGKDGFQRNGFHVSRVLMTFSIIASDHPACDHRTRSLAAAPAPRITHCHRLSEFPAVRCTGPVNYPADPAGILSLAPQPACHRCPSERHGLDMPHKERCFPLPDTHVTLQHYESPTSSRDQSRVAAAAQPPALSHKHSPQLWSSPHFFTA